MSHLKKCLDNYTALNGPGYAVLVTGAWGTGKTYQVQECIPEDERCYVSLYGVQTVEQLHSDVAVANALSMARTKMMPNSGGDLNVPKLSFYYRFTKCLKRLKLIIASNLPNFVLKSSLYYRFTKWLKRLKLRIARTPSNFNQKQLLGAGSDIADAMKVILPQFGQGSSLLMAVLKLTLSNERTIVFDDLERISEELDLKDALGAINYYVEHRDFRVVVIAHDKKLTDEMQEMKEKTFGRFIPVEPNVDEALTHFASGLPEMHSKEFISSQKAGIVEVFNQSNVKSLRILHRAVTDLSQLYSILKEEHHSNTKAMEYLVKYFMAFELEVRAGHLSEIDLRERSGARERFQKEEGNKNSDKCAFVKANLKYSTIDLENGLLNDNVLCAIVVGGQFPEKEIRESIDSSSEFLVPEKDPPWKVVKHLDELIDADFDDVVENAIEDLDRQFKNQEVTNPGELLHIFSLRMKLAKDTIIMKDVETIIDENIKYIDQLVEKDLLPPYNPWNSWDDEIGNSFDGIRYSYMHEFANQFNKTKEYLRSSQGKVFRSIIPELQKNFLNRFEKNPKKFLIELSTILRHRNANIPVLHLICPIKFVDTWLTVPREWRGLISSALVRRCETKSNETEFDEERIWAGKVVSEITHRAEKYGLRSYKIKKLYLPKLHFVKQYANFDSSTETRPEVAPNIESST